MPPEVTLKKREFGVACKNSFSDVRASFLPAIIIKKGWVAPLIITAFWEVLYKSPGWVVDY